MLTKIESLISFMDPFTPIHPLRISKLGQATSKSPTQKFRALRTNGGRDYTPSDHTALWFVCLAWTVLPCHYPYHFLCSLQTAYRQTPKHKLVFF